MTVQTITMPRLDAWNALQVYRAALKRQHSETDAAITAAYRELARDRKVLDLLAVMRAAGVDARGRPKLAIQRADCERVYARVLWDGSAEFTVHPPGGRRRNEAAEHCVQLPSNTFPRPPAGTTTVDCRARVPFIPPPYRLRPNMAGYHLLWEASWEEAPRDPFLLRHLGQYFYVVLASWDLTEVERAVIRG